MNLFHPSNIPPYISALVADLEHWISAATARSVNDEAGERYSLREDDINTQLRALGWDATLADTGRWMPIPSGFTIINDPPDPHFYPRRCYQVPESPAEWRALWDGKREVRFRGWREAYAFVFAYLAQEQARLPRTRFRVRPPRTWGGDDYVAHTADQAIHLHLNYWLSLGWITVQQVMDLQLNVFEHCGDCTFYCSACQHAPCTYSPGSQWTMPTTPGWIGSSL